MGCEERYKKQKIKLEFENFSETSVESIMQEFWTTVLAMNIFLLQCVDEEGLQDPKAPPRQRTAIVPSLRRITPPLLRLSLFFICGSMILIVSL